MSPNASPAPGPAAPFRGRLAVAAAVTFAAGVVHAAAAVPHFGDDPLLGSAFAITGWAQILLAGLLLRRQPARATVGAALAVNLAALGALVVARTVGLPVGHGGVEPITLPDTTTAVLELAAVVVLGGWLRRPERLGAPQGVVLGTLGVAGVLAISGSTVAVAALGTGGHGHEGPSAADHHGPEGVATGTVDDAPVHVHADESVHVHAAGQGHQHDDGSVHVHPEPALQQPSPQPTATEDHTHAPGEGHG